MKTSANTVLDTPEGSLVDLGDGVACLEYHTKMNTFNPALSAFVDQARQRAEQDFAALVIANDAKHFSAGYDLNLFLQAVEAADWSGIDAMLRDFQAAFLAVKYARIPVVAAPRGYTLGAGCECVLHCTGVVAAPELAMGLPELTVGVLPAGGGTTQMLVRVMADADPATDAFPHVERVFDLLAFPRRSTNAYDARRMGFLRPTDTIVRNADRLLFEAKRHALAMAEAGYRPPPHILVHVGGEETLALLRVLLDHGHQADYDRVIADRIAWVLSGGNLLTPQDVSEEYLLSLERQAFLTLMREPKTVARMKHTLQTGKPLKN